MYFPTVWNFTLVESLFLHFQRKYQEISAANEELGLMIHNSSMGLKKRKLENHLGEPICPVGDIDSWSGLYQKQDDLEKLRLYYTLVAWRIINIVYPSHEMIGTYNEILKSPEFMQQKIREAAGDIDDISDSMSLLGHVPQYHLLSNEQNYTPMVKTEQTN